MSTIWEETKHQGSKMKGRPFKEKLGYFWEYYRLPVMIIAGALAIIISLVRAWATSKDYALSIVMVNSIAGSLEGVTDGWISDLTYELDFDTKEYEVSIDDSIMIGGENVTANQEYASIQKFAALLSSQSIDILTADTPVFEQYAQNQYIMDLRDVFPEEYLTEMSDYIYYTDAATYSDYETDDPGLDVRGLQASYTIDHHNPSSMRDPVPIGFFAPAGSRLEASGVYALLPSEKPYQGHVPEAVVGIMINTPRTEAAVTGIRYLISP